MLSLIDIMPKTKKEIWPTIFPVAEFTKYRLPSQQIIPFINATTKINKLKGDSVTFFSALTSTDTWPH